MAIQNAGKQILCGDMIRSAFFNYADRCLCALYLGIIKSNTNTVYDSK